MTSEVQPIPVIPYSPVLPSRGWVAVAARIALLLALLSALLTPVLMSIFTTEAIVFTGAAACVFGLLTFWLGTLSTQRSLARLGLSHSILAVAIFVVINVGEVSPGQAHAPVLAVSILFLMGTIPMTAAMFLRSKAQANIISA